VFEIFLFIFCSIGLIILAMLFHKVRKLHLASYELVEKARSTDSEVNALYSQLQSYLDLQLSLGFEKPLPMLRGWAGSPDFLLLLANHAIEKKPGLIVECSSGSSTIVLAQALKMNGGGHVYSLEHDEIYVGRTNNELLKHGLNDYATVLYAPLEKVKGLDDYFWYSTNRILELIGNDTLDMLVVDGPPYDTCREARYPALPVFHDKFSEGSSIFLDDASREDETSIVKQWLINYPDFSGDFLPLEKGCAVLTRKN